MSILSFRNVSFAYPGQPSSIEDISFEINKGQFISLIGPNGGGKTTLLRLLMGLLKPQSGTIVNHASTIGYVSQQVSQQNPPLPCTVEEMVYAAIPVSSHTAAENALNIVDLQQLRTRDIRSLSGGQRQRVFIARALAMKPDLLILDEPTVGVDAASQESFFSFLSYLHTELKITILFVTHDVEAVVNLSEQVISINKTIQCVEPASALHKSKNVEQLYGKHHLKVHHTH